MTVWTYWEGNRVPYIDLCLDTIRKYSKGLNFVLLNDNLVKTYLNLPFKYNKLSVVHKADYIRVALLCKYGGIWLDADTIVLKPLVKLVNFLEKYKFMGFGLLCSPHTAAIAGKPDSLILNVWLNYINKEIYKNSIAWGDLGPLALSKVLGQVGAIESDEYYNVTSNFCTPVSCVDWKFFFSERKLLEDIIYDETIIVMLYNKFMKHRLNKYDREFILSSNMIISRLLRRALC